MLTIKDVAKRAGVSQATVSRVLNNTKPVRLETRRQIESIIQELHYTPNPNAVNLGRKRQKIIGLAYSYSQEESIQVLRNTEAFAREKNIPLQIRSTQPDAHSELEAISCLIAFGCNPVFAHVSYLDDATLSSLLAYYPQLHLIDRGSNTNGAHCALYDHKKAGELFASALKQSGTSQNLCVFALKPSVNATIREKTFRDKCEHPISVQRATNSFSAGEQMIHNLISSGLIPETIVTDLMDTALGMLVAFNEIAPRNTKPPTLITFGLEHSVHSIADNFVNINYPIQLLTKRIISSAFNQHEDTEAKRIKLILPTIKIKGPKLNTFPHDSK
ncbi:LacI family transcriptional regulator [Alteromonas sp. KC3]|uniref:LacI family DNA-binding transcriptional regulator n=1 Tax=unclassified Alteromonas TaxID=2614992 RepID=UPI001923A638|nr:MULTISPECIES: LacI family DNA-binding transcriptional regulator [unclassified Alteromonas]BCO18802.1 LacI family transcriptional regulator [Alteromonas sp. KC3]BCO22765.1 LacI family transcriptional regulator [Alteromonas sp. KC14]